MDIRIPLVKNTFFNEDVTKRKLADFVKSTSFFSMGKECAAFESEFATWQGRRYALFFNSGGSANLALIQALLNLELLKHNDAVGFSAVTWSTNVMPLIQLGLQPVPLDCSFKTLNISPDSLLDTLRNYNLKALFITNTLGFCDDIFKIKKICNEKGIILLEDNCESLGSELCRIKLGNFGLGSTFSFFISHHMTTIEGGMICTDDKKLYLMLKIVRANGWDRNFNDEEAKTIRALHDINDDFTAKYTFYDLGYNLRPTELAAVLGRVQLPYLGTSIDKREQNFMRINNAILGNNDLIPIDIHKMNKVSNFAIPILCKTAVLRNKYITALTEAGIEIRPLIAGNIQHQPFYDKYGLIHRDLRGAEKIHECGLYCGNHPDYTKDDVDYIIKHLGGK